MEDRKRRIVRHHAGLLAIVLAIPLAACTNPFAAPTPASPSTAPAAPAGRLPIDPQVSPVSFQWLAPDAILVAPETSTRKLAALGNVIARAAESRPSVRLAIYDDAEGWQAEEAEPARVVPRRAEYEKRSDADPVERFVVFGKDGNALYERDFRDYPLGPTDEPIERIP